MYLQELKEIKVVLASINSVFEKIEYAPDDIKEYVQNLEILKMHIDHMYNISIKLNCKTHDVKTKEFLKTWKGFNFKKGVISK